MIATRAPSPKWGKKKEKEKLIVSKEKQHYLLKVFQLT
jgi:hypothetical protein